MKRETLSAVLECLNKIDRALENVPHGIAVKILHETNEVKDTILGEEFNAQEIMGGCEGCEALLLSDDEYLSSDDGCKFCAGCTAQWKLEQVAQPSESLQ